MECLSRSGSGSGRGENHGHVYRTGHLSLHKLINYNVLSSFWTSDLFSWGVLKLLPVIHPAEDMPSPSHLRSLQLLTKKEGESFRYSWKNVDRAPGDCCSHAIPLQSMVDLWPSWKILVQNVFGRVLLFFMIWYCNVTYTVPGDCPLSLHTRCTNVVNRERSLMDLQGTEQRRAGLSISKMWIDTSWYYCFSSGLKAVYLKVILQSLGRNL